MPVCGVYTITNEVNGKVYVGSSVNVERRWSQHRYLLNAGKHTSKHLQFAWTESGAPAFKFEVVEVVGREARAAAEQVWLDTTMCYSREKGYNMAVSVLAPATGYRHTQAVKDAMAAARRGRKASSETRAKIGAARRGRQASLETKEKMRLAHLGHTHTQETRRRASEVRMGKPRSEVTKAKIRAAYAVRREQER